MSYLKTISDDSKVIEVPLLVTECTLTFVRPTAPSSNIHQRYATVKVRWARGTWVTDDCFPLIACLSYQWLPNNASARQKSARLSGYRTHRKFRVTTEYRVHTLFYFLRICSSIKKKILFVVTVRIVYVFVCFHFTSFCFIPRFHKKSLLSSKALSNND